MKPVKNIIFDLDGTLVDSAPDIIENLTKALIVNSVEPLPQLGKQIVGPPLRDMIANLPIHQNGDKTESVVADFRKFYDNSELLNTKEYFGVIETIQNLKCTGFHMFIATNKPIKSTLKIVDHLFPNCFEDIVCIDSESGKTISKNEMVASILRRNKLAATETCVVGDGVSDIHAAVANRCIAIGVTYGYSNDYTLHQSGANILINNIIELRNILNIAAKKWRCYEKNC